VTSRIKIAAKLKQLELGRERLDLAEGIQSVLVGNDTKPQVNG
jgi:hypothetical protein